MGDTPPLVLVGVTGGVAAYKTCELVRRLVEAGRDVRCALTPDAARFVGPQLLAALTRKPVLDDRPVLDGTYPHLDAARAAAVVCIAPCTANTLAKLAWGLADNVVTQSALSTPAPLLVAPAMNVRMWHHPATQANVARLRERGVVFVGPGRGRARRGRAGHGPHGRAARDRRRDRGAARAARPARSRAGACSSPPAARASRSTPCASSATARPAGWASRSPPRRAPAAPRS